MLKRLLLLLLLALSGCWAQTTATVFRLNPPEQFIIPGFNDNGTTEVFLENADPSVIGWTVAVVTPDGQFLVATVYREPYLPSNMVSFLDSRDEFVYVEDLHVKPSAKAKRHL